MPYNLYIYIYIYNISVQLDVTKRNSFVSEFRDRVTESSEHRLSNQRTLNIAANPNSALGAWRAKLTPSNMNAVR